MVEKCIQGYMRRTANLGRRIQAAYTVLRDGNKQDVDAEIRKMSIIQVKTDFNEKYPPESARRHKQELHEYLEIIDLKDLECKRYVITVAPHKLAGQTWVFFETCMKGYEYGKKTSDDMLERMKICMSARVQDLTGNTAQPAQPPQPAKLYYAGNLYKVGYYIKMLLWKNNINWSEWDKISA